MSFESIKHALKKAVKHDSGYAIDISAKDFMDLVDLIDDIEDEKKKFITTISAKKLLEILPEKPYAKPIIYRCNRCQYIQGVPGTCKQCGDNQCQAT